MAGSNGSARAAALAAELHEAASALVALLEGPIDTDRWRHVPAPGVWSVSKEAAHVADAAAYHHWIVQRSTGEAVPSRYPPLERREMTSDLSPSAAADLVRRRAEETRDLVAGLSDQQLDRPTRPPRAGGRSLGDTIARVLIGHYAVHREGIEAKLRAPGR